ncbi:MAG: hypothetical protein JNK82_05645 [Myxococcaceae bacterium]|nr:hypothetical protein [Myxococcaceae bacterium]
MKAALLAAVAVAAPALAASVSLDYQRPDGAECPDDAALKKLVAARLGVDPFAELAASRVRVTVTAPAAQPLQAEVVLENPGAPPRRKVLTGVDCVELVQSVAMAVAIAVDAVVKRPEPAPAPAPEPAAPPASSPPPEPVKPAATPLTWSLSAGASVNAGLSIGPQPTLRAEGRLRSSLWSIGLEGRFAWPVTGALAQGALTTSALLGAVVPCLHWKWLAGCADVSLGGLRLEGSSLLAVQAATVFHASAGLRVLFTVPLTEHFSLGAMAEGQVPFTRATALVGSDRAWTVSPVGGGVGAWATFTL